VRHPERAHVRGPPQRIVEIQAQEQGEGQAGDGDERDEERAGAKPVPGPDTVRVPAQEPRRGQQEEQRRRDQAVPAGPARSGGGVARGSG